ncbi:MAG: tetratricopeptide repeat protein [Candidatus Gastranaerophilales bacterium]|nr:tetratricopeptide repeat protein [Candidatus Gastranaerophilales bacterium]
MNKTNDIILDALELINKEDFKGAKELLLHAIELEPDKAESYKNLGLCEVNLNNNQEALNAFKHAYELDNKDATTVYYYACCLSATDKQEAAGLFRDVIALRSEYVDAYKSLAMMYVEMGQLDSSIEVTLSALNNPKIEPNYSLNYICATSYMLKKDYENAIKYLKTALELEPEHMPIINSLATCYMNIQDYDCAQDILEKAYEKDSENPLTAYNLGICHQVKQEYKEALVYFQNAYRYDPSISMLSSLAFCALKSGDAMLASNLYQNLVAAYPNNVDYRYSYSEALEELGEYERALENVQMLLDLDEKNIVLTKKKGTYLRKLGRNEESNDVFTTLLNRGKIDVEVYYNLAFNFVELGDFDNAKEMFKKCIILEPENPYAHKDLGVLYLKMNCYDWAVDEMLAAIRIEDDVAEFHYSLGVSYMMLSNPEKAKVSFLKALSLDSEDANCLAYLGYVYMLERDLEAARETLQKALKLEPENFLAKSHIAKLYFQMQKYDTAKELLQDIIEKTQDDETMNMLGICYLELKDYEKAAGIFYKLVLNYPKNHILLINLAKCEHALSRDKEALEHTRQALMIYDDYQDALNLLEELTNG